MMPPANLPMKPQRLAPMADYVPQLKWRKTCGEKEGDFVADSPLPGHTIGQFYQHNTRGIYNGHWTWFYQAAIPGLGRSERFKLSGYAETPHEAAKAIENQWFEAIEGKVLDVERECYVDAPSEGAAEGP
jgi:hypothetical protein